MNLIEAQSAVPQAFHPHGRRRSEPRHAPGASTASCAPPPATRQTAQPPSIQHSPRSRAVEPALAALEQRARLASSGRAPLARSCVLGCRIRMWQWDQNDCACVSRGAGWYRIDVGKNPELERLRELRSLRSSRDNARFESGPYRGAVAQSRSKPEGVDPLAGVSPRGA
jgi:hypothetical protein